MKKQKEKIPTIDVPELSNKRMLLQYNWAEYELLSQLKAMADNKPTWKQFVFECVVRQAIKDGVNIEELTAHIRAGIPSLIEKAMEGKQ